MKKTIATIILVLIILTLLIPKSYAIGFTMQLTPEKKTVAPGNTVTVTLATNNVNIGGDGMNVFSCFLTYDKTVFEAIKAEDITGLNNWSVSYNTSTGKILLDNKSFITTDSELCTITFKLKADVTIENTTIQVTDPKTSNNKIDISGTAGETTIYVKQLASDKYEITEDNKIKGISPDTSIDEFKENLIGGDKITITDANGNTINAGNVGTGTTIKTPGGETYTLIVKGDTNGDGKVTSTDLSQVKLHVVETTLLKEPYKSASDINLDNQVTITDLSQLKLVLVGSKVL